MVNKDGKTVSPTSEAYSGRRRECRLEFARRTIGVILANQPGAGSWPMTAATFILIPKQPADAAAAAEALKFFAWAYAKGEQDGRRARLCPDAEEGHRASREAWAREIKDGGGKPL